MTTALKKLSKQQQCSSEMNKFAKTHSKRYETSCLKEGLKKIVELDDESFQGGRRRVIEEFVQAQAESKQRGVQGKAGGQSPAE